MKNRVYELRKEKGWSIRYLAQKSGVSKTAISNFERGLSTPTADTISWVAEALGVSENELLGRKPPINPSDYPQKTKEEYMAELQEVFSGIETKKVRYFYIFTLAKLGIQPEGGVTA